MKEGWKVEVGHGSRIELVVIRGKAVAMGMRTR